MAKPPKLSTYFHLHLISDSTGETLNAVAKAACAQFDMGRPIEHIYPLVRNLKQLDRAFAEIESAPGPIISTIVNQENRARLAAFAERSALPICFALDGPLTFLSDYLGESPGGDPLESELSTALVSTVDAGFAGDVATLLASLEGCRGHDESAAEGDNRVALPISAAELSQLREAGHAVLKARTRMKARGALKAFVSALQNVLKKLHNAVATALNLAASTAKPLAGYGRRVIQGTIDNAGAAVLFAVAYRASELLPQAMEMLQKLLP